MIGNIKGAVFDMDGTLVDSLFLWEVIWSEFGKRFLGGEKFAITLEDDKAVRTMTLKDAMNYLHGIYSLGESGEELLNAANEIMENFYANDVLLKDGVREFLDYCLEHNIKMCIASATDIRLVNVAVEHCGIGKYFTHIVSCAQIGKGKEEPDVYLKAMELLGTTVENSCVFEDSLVAIETADKIGMKTVGIYDKYNYGHERMKEFATEYIDEGETLVKLIL